MGNGIKLDLHIHSVISDGSDTPSEILALVKKAKEKINGLSLTSDIIVGFPGETEEDFKETLSVVKEVEYSSLFTFIFSPRKGTPAEIMEDPISREEKGKWFAELLKVQDKIGLKKHEELVGKTVRVLCEELSDREGYIVGKTNGTASVEFLGGEELIGKFAEVKIEAYINNVLNGSLINN